MPRVTGVDQHSLLEAALEGLEARKQRIEVEIAQIQAVLGRRGRGRPAAKLDGDSSSASKRSRRTLNAAARRRIAAAQKKRWAEYRKKKAAQGA